LLSGVNELKMKRGMDMSNKKDVTYIVFDGYYDEDDEFQEHNELTSHIYQKGLSMVYKPKDTDVFLGAFFEEDTWWADWDLNGEQRNFRIC